MSSVQFEGEGQQVGTPAPETQPNTTPEVLTPEQIETQIEKAVSKAFRAIQSSQSKQEQRIKQFVQQQVNVFRGQGVEVTPEMERAITASVKEQFVEPESKDEPETQPAQVAKPKPAARGNDPSEAFAFEQADLFDVDVLDPKDPEAAMLEGAKSLKEWKRLVVEATIAKAERVRANPPQVKPIPSAVSAAGVDSTQSLATAYKTELLANRGKGMVVGEQIKEKYRKLGLDVDTVSLR